MNNESIKKLLCKEINSLAEELEREVTKGPCGEVDYTKGKLNECMLIYHKLFPLEGIPTSLWEKVCHVWDLAEKWRDNYEKQ